MKIIAFHLSSIDRSSSNYCGRVVTNAMNTQGFLSISDKAKRHVTPSKVALRLVQLVLSVHTLPASTVP